MSGGGLKGGSVTVGYRYYMGMHFGICAGPVDSIDSIEIDNRVAGWLNTSGAPIQSMTASMQVGINAPTMFGGDHDQGGLVGQAWAMMGEATQTAPSYLTTYAGAQQPGYRGLTTFLYDGQICANNPFPKTWKFLVSRYVNGWQNNAPWYSTKAQVPGVNTTWAGQNPAHIVYETLTNSDWGMGYPVSSIDDANFRAAADQLYSENFGLNILWERQDSIESFLQQVMDCISGVIATDRTTGLFQLNLIRGGYNPATLPSFTQDDIVSFDSMEAPSLNGVTNEIILRYTSTPDNVYATTGVQNMGAIQAQGVVVSQSKDMLWITDSDLANRVAMRELNQASTPLKRFKIKLNRNAWSLKPGDVFNLTFPPLGISAMVCRVGDIDYGTIASGAISVTALEDIFALPTSYYTAVQATGWTPPDYSAHACSLPLPMEASYRMLYRALSASDLAGLTDVDTYAGVTGARPSSMSINFQLWTSPDGVNYYQHGMGDWCPWAQVTAAIGPYDTVITIGNSDSLDAVIVGSAAYIGVWPTGEEVRVDAINAAAGTVTIGRGCLDTPPKSHIVGETIWFYDGYIASDGVQYTAGETSDSRLLTVAPYATLQLVSAPVVALTMEGRQAAPYAPAYLTVNGARWDLLTKITGPLSATWKERNRVTQQDKLIDDTMGTVTPEAGTSYTVTLQDGTGATFSTFSGLTSPSWSWATPDDTHTQMGMTVTAVRGGLSSWRGQVLPYTTPRSGYGLTYGSDYGGA